jgi:iron(III) transport system ATP-binding protein
VDTTPLSHFRAALQQNAHLRMARRLHFVSAGRAPRAHDCSAGRRSTAGKNFDTHGEWRSAFDRESLSDHGDSVPCPPRDSGTGDPSAIHIGMNHVELHGVSKTFGDRVVLNDLSLQIEKAERLVLFGPSGSGKTTVLRLVAGLEIPDKGEIRIEGRIVARSGKNLVPPEKRNVGMVFQDLALWPHMTVQQNLMFGLTARGVQKHHAEVRVREMLHRVDLEHRIDAKPHQLSGGEQQRIALARALVARPSILLMDEPLSSLEDERKRTIASDLLGLHRQFRFTLVYVTHDQTETDLLASRVCRMHDLQPRGESTAQQKQSDDGEENADDSLP